jgi:hypothetical protein
VNDVVVPRGTPSFATVSGAGAANMVLAPPLVCCFEQTGAHKRRRVGVGRRSWSQRHAREVWERAGDTFSVYRHRPHQRMERRATQRVACNDPAPMGSHSETGFAAL